MNYGYVRVSTREQNEDRQLKAMLEAGVTEDAIFLDKQSGKDFNRSAYQQLLETVQTGDVIFIKSIDRLGRNYDEIIEQWREISKNKGVDIVVLDMPILDTREDKNLIGRFISDIVLQILSFVAETERSVIKQRQAEGMEAAKARGVQFGRPPGKEPEGFDNIAERYVKGELSCTAAAAMVGWPISTFLDRVRRKGMVKTNHSKYNQEAKCVICGKIFIAGARNAKYCSNECKITAERERAREREKKGSNFHSDYNLEYPPKICVICGKEFVPRSPMQKTCSEECSKENRYLTRKRRRMKKC